jgi:hypothetical protein
MQVPAAVSRSHRGPASETRLGSVRPEWWCSLRDRDIIFDVMWSVELEPEVETWFDNLTVKSFATAFP